MSRAQGSSLQHTWKTLKTHELNISQEQKAKIVFQLEIITWQLSRLRFNQAESLFEKNEEFHIKTCLFRDLLLNQRYTLEDISREPFKFENDYYETQISTFLEHVKYLALDHHCFFASIFARSEYDDDAEFRAASDWWNDFVTVESKINSSHNRIDFVIADETLSVMITKWAHDLSDDLLRNDQRRFVIHHSDLSVNNIFVDEEFNITCIIDWAFCSTVLLFILLTASDLSQSRHELDESLLPMFEKEFRHALEENVQHEDVNAESRLCWMLSRSRSMWLFSRILTFDSITDCYLFKALWESIENYDQEMTEFFRSMQSSKKYSSLHIELKKDDQTTLQVTELKREYFDKDVDHENTASSNRSSEIGESQDRYSTWISNSRVKRCLTLYRQFVRDAEERHQDWRQEYFCWDSKHYVWDWYCRHSAQHILFNKRAKDTSLLEF